MRLNISSIDQSRLEQRGYEVPVLLTKRTKFRGAEVVFVKAPTGELRFARGRRRVRVLELDDAVAPAFWEDRRLKIDTVDGEAMKLLEGRELARQPSTGRRHAARRAAG